MKPINKSVLLLCIAFSLLGHSSMAQDDTTGKPVVKLHYYNNNNSVQWLILESQMKRGKTFTPQQNKVYQLYLDSSNTPNLIAKMTTDERGKAKEFLPPSLKAIWDGADTHTFIVKEGEEDIITDYAISKAKIKIDTINEDGVRSIKASFTKYEKAAWVPAKDVEMKLGIERLGGILSAGDEATYTTDSTGTVTVELKKLNLPGDEKGNYMLAAKVEDNDQFGNLQVEQAVPWGVVTVPNTTFFNQRTLWTTRFRTPFWLLFMAYGIVISVWSTLIYLVFQIVKIKKLGTQKV